MFDPAPFPPLTFNLHIVLGAIGLVGATVALISRKGTVIHKAGGWAMTSSMVVACVTALLFMLDKFSVPPVMNSMTALCGLIAAVLALKPSGKGLKQAELAVSMVLLITFLWFAFKAIPNILSGQVFFLGPVVVALAAVIFLVGDVHYFTNYRERIRLRVRRHMVRMIWSTAVLVRAPLFELRDEFGFSLPAVLAIPMLVALVMTFYFWPKANKVV